MQCRRAGIGALTCATALILFCACRAGYPEGGSPDYVATILSLNAPDNSITMAIADRERPVTTSLEGDLPVSAVCRHCSMTIRFLAKDAQRNCAACQCNATNRDCISAVTSSSKLWQDAFRSLPRGTVIRPTFRDPRSTDSGLKSLIVDPHSVLIPVDGIANLPASRLDDLIKPVHGSAPRLCQFGRQLRFAVKDAWTDAAEVKVEKSIRDSGGSVRWTDPPTPVN